MKDRAKTFMFVAFGFMALVIAFQMGAQSVNAQGGEVVSIATSGGNHYAITASGDVYHCDNEAGWYWEYASNIFTGGVRTQDTSVGAVKAKYGGAR